tara:strand:- start:13779 stop:15722 length:1944 start_codon:yes stop_codon:yes gene_type:complete
MSAQVPGNMIEESRLDSDLSKVIRSATKELLSARMPDGHWVFELEADSTISAEYILLGHFLDERDSKKEEMLSNYIRSNQEDHGGWPLFKGGGLDISCSVKAYWALKLSGDNPAAPHMEKAREAILQAGGAAQSNVFTRTTLALFGQVPWRAIPAMPVEIICLPKWFPFHLTKVSYWSRTTLVPLMILMSLKAKARNPTSINVRELFCNHPNEEKYFHTNTFIEKIIYKIDRILKVYERVVPKFIRRIAINRALRWCLIRINGVDGLGAIFPPMANLLMVLDTLGYKKNDENRILVRESIDKLLTKPNFNRQYCQPCLSPIWDTGLALHAVLESGDFIDAEIMNTLNWLVEKQILDFKGDWAHNRNKILSGGWAFQYNNDYYPDVDDTAVVAAALHRADPQLYSESIRRARDWIIGMQSKNGGWGAFDADNEARYLNHIPFADHGALLDPPTADVTARCVSFLCQIGENDHPAVERGISFLISEQEEDGSWFGRWGTNYIYGTWSVLCALNAAGVAKDSDSIKLAVKWLKSIQHSDGGWGETGNSYYKDRVSASLSGKSNPSQTAWATLGLMAVGEVNSIENKKGISYLLKADRTGEKWDEDEYTAVGFPRVFYLRYDGYSAYFPLWSLARYRDLSEGNKICPTWGL